MKNDLMYQSSEYDCGPASMTNAIRFLFEREEILPGLLKHIWLMGNDTYCEKGCVGCHGTSKSAMRYMADWFNEYSCGWKFPIAAEFLEQEETKVLPGSKTWKCLEKGGCAVVRCWAGGVGHYVLLTALLPGEEIGLFDPYDEEPEWQGADCRVIRDAPKRMNRAVRYSRLNRLDSADYAMGPWEKRENLLIWRTNAAAAAEDGEETRRKNNIEEDAL